MFTGLAAAKNKWGIPKVNEDEVVLVKQFRPALDAYTIEAPAGLIDENETLEGALDSAEGMKKSKLKERLIEHRANAELSRVLVTLREDCGLPVDLDDMKLAGVPAIDGRVA